MSGANTKKYAEAMKWRDWQTCDLICEEHETLVKEIDELKRRLMEAEEVMRWTSEVEDDNERLNEYLSKHKIIT
jgi:predicted alpha-1,6-mannanase (GH76 family)